MGTYVLHEHLFVVKCRNYPLVQRAGIWLAVIGGLIGFALVAVIIWIFIAASSW